MEKIKNRYHLEILAEIKRVAPAKKIPPRVLGTPHPCYSLSNPQKRKLVSVWYKVHRDISVKEFVYLLDSLYRGKSYDEKTLAGILLETGRFHLEIKPKKVGEWLNFLEGWAEIDTTCQSSFSPKELLGRWSKWKSLLEELVKDKNIHKRRASLVLLTKSVRESADSRLAKIAFANIEKLKSEKEVLITKAVSWLLRSLIKHHKKEVAAYLKKNQTSLPKIALRKTLNKLKTGKKSLRIKR